MKTYRKIFVIGLVAMMVLGCTACGSKKDTSSTVRENASEETQADENLVTEETSEENDGAGSETYGDLLPYFQYNQIYGEEDFDAVEAAAYDYLAFDAESDYDPSNVMIPYVSIVDIDESDAEDVLIYGDFWLWEFEKDDDILVAVSGGHRPGIIHAERFGEDETAIYSALSMDEAYTDDEEEGLFGEYYDDYVSISSNQDARDEKTAKIIADYVNANDIEVTKYQLSGEDPKELK